MGGMNSNFWKYVSSILRPAVDTWPVAGHGLIADKDSTASPARLNNPSTELTFNASYWNGSSEVETAVRINLVQDGAANWLSFKKIDDTEFMLIRADGDAYTLYSRQASGGAGIIMGSTEALASTDYVVSYRDALATLGGTFLGGITGHGNFVAGNAFGCLGTKGVDVLGSNLAINGGFEDFTKVSNVDDWEIDDLDPVGEGASINGIAYRTTDCSSGTYALRLEAQLLPCNCLASQLLTSLDASPATYQSKVKAKGSGNLAALYLDDDTENWRYAYNFTTTTWDNLSGDEDNLTADHYNIQAVTTSFVEYTIPAAVTPASGKMYPMLGLSGTGSDYVIIDEAQFFKVGVGTNLLLNDGFETYTSPEYLYADNFYVFPDGGDLDRSLSNQRTGLACYKSTGSGPSVFNWVGQMFTGLSGDYRISIYGKDAAETSDVGFGVFNSAITHYYDFDDNTWKVLGGGSPFFPEAKLTSSYTEITADFNTGIYTDVMVAVVHFSSADEVAYLDDFTLKPVTYPDPIKVTAAENPSDAARLNEDDYIFKHTTVGGTAKEWFALNGEEEFETDMDSWDFETSAIPMLVHADNTELSAAVNAYSGIVLLGKTAIGGINIKNVDTIDTDFTMPDGYRLINPMITVVLETGNSVTGDFQISLGNNDADYNNVSDAFSPAVNSPSNQRTFNTVGSTYKILNQAGLVKIKLTSADSGTSGTATVYLLGTLVPKT